MCDSVICEPPQHIKRQHPAFIVPTAETISCHQSLLHLLLLLHTYLLPHYFLQVAISAWMKRFGEWVKSSAGEKYPQEHRGQLPYSLIVTFLWTFELGD
jgi:hypothetical protein